MNKPLTNKVLLLGVDGLDPKLTSKYLKQGLLPNIEKYVRSGAQRENLQLICTPPTITPPLIWIPPAIIWIPVYVKPKPYGT